jgi:hypothetical protein
VLRNLTTAATLRSRASALVLAGQHGYDPLRHRTFGRRALRIVGRLRGGVRCRERFRGRAGIARLQPGLGPSEQGPHGRAGHWRVPHRPDKVSTLTTTNHASHTPAQAVSRGLHGTTAVDDAATVGTCGGDHVHASVNTV